MNNRPSKDSQLPAMIGNSQLIAAALMLGVTSLIFIASIVGGSVKSATPVLACLALAFAALVSVLRLIIPGMYVNNQLKELKDAGASSIAEKLQGLFQTRMILGMALLVGAVLFNLFAYVIDGQWFSMVTAVFLLLLMIMMFPTMRKFERWVEDIEKSLSSHF